MSSAQLIAIAVVVVPALAVVLWPLVRERGGRGPAPGVPVSDRRLELLEQKGAAYRALKELTFDYEAGHLSEDDYRELSGRYESRAGEVLAALDALAPAAAETPPARDRARPEAAPASPAPSARRVRAATVLRLIRVP